MSTKMNVREIVISAIVAALYVAITFVFSAVSFGPLQFRVAEILNCLVVYDRRYIWGVSLGVLIANLQSSLGIIDITWGTLTTLITLSIVIIAIRKLTDNRVKLALTVIITTILMGFLVALDRKSVV